MDFGSLLQTAKENEQNKREVRSYSTKFSAPKKEEKKARTLSANIQKFLAKKEAEEKQLTQAANRKRDELLALRSKDKKAQRRVNVMLKRTKSANQSVIEDAVDRDNTAVTLAGPSQPDEDDYGYVSQEAAAFYNKMMEKYSKMPDDPKFSLTKRKASSNLSSTKDRVRAALEKEKEDAMLPHRRKRKHRDELDNEVDECEKSYSREEKKESSQVKQKTAGPPPMNFSELLKLAAQKQHEPIVIEVKPKEEEGPLLTKKQKKEQERVQQWKEGRKQNSKMPPGKPTSEQTENRIPKLSSVQLNNNKIKEIGDKPIAKLNNCYKNNEKTDKGNIQNSYNNSSKLSKSVPTSVQNTKVHERDSNILKSALKSQKSVSKSDVSTNKSDVVKQRPLNGLPKKNMDAKMIPNKSSSNFKEQEKKIVVPKTTSNSSTIHSVSKPVSKPTFKKDLKVNSKSKEIDKQKLVSVKEKELPPKRFPPNDLKSKQFPPNDLKPKQFPPNDLKPKQFPPKDLKSKQFPPPDVRRREFPQKDIKRKPPLGSKRRILDDDDEYDSEMDDFIDDGPEEMEDYSKYIKDIFGYDKSRYRGIDEDDIDNMESSFAQQMREDIRSTKLGIMEDLEDIQREKEEKRRKALMKKRRL